MFYMDSPRLPSLDLTSTPPGPLPTTPTEYFSLSPEQLSQSSSGSALHHVSSGTAISVQYSTGVSSSPDKIPMTRSCNVKEYDEELDRLDKENVDLKIRIHLMEEKYGTRPQKSERNSLKRAYLELQMETDDLKKKLKEKQELVQNASKLLLVLDKQYKNELDRVKESHERLSSELQLKIAQLQKDLLKCNMDSNFDRGHLTQLCDLAFDGVEGEETPSAFKSLKNETNDVSSAVPQGIFSVPTAILLQENNEDRNLTSISPDRLKQLEEQLVLLEAKVVDLEEQIDDKQRTSSALQDDVNNLKKELEDREDKLVELESEVMEKDQKVDQLMENLETRHLEIEAKDTTIQTLHDDLNKVEPEIVAKVQQLIERDKIIDQKIDQLQQQNKILVEIQITLDEKQKQIAELEAQLRQEQEKSSKTTQELMCACLSMKMFLERINVLESENFSIRKDLKRKERKIRDLVAELKEALELVNKVKWEAEMSGCEDGVKEMAEEENERVWAELEQKKRDLISMKDRMDLAAKEAAEKIHHLCSQAEETELKIKNLQKLLDEDRKRNMNFGDGISDSELLALKEKIESRDSSLRNQQSLIDNLKGELSSSKSELTERKEEMKELKMLLHQKNADVQDFIAKELLGRTQEVRDLQAKLGGFTGQDNQLDIIKMFMEVKGSGHDRKETRDVPLPQVRSNSMSQLREEVPSKPDKKDDWNDNCEIGSKAGRSSSFSQLENALYAQMGQKVYNTNQTFNTYVMSGSDSNSKMNTDLCPTVSNSTIVPTETLERELLFNNASHDDQAKTLLNNIISKNKPPCHESSSKSTEGGVSSFNQRQPLKIDNNLQLIYDEMKKFKEENRALREEKEVLCLKVLSLQISTPTEEPSTINCYLQKHLEESRDKKKIVSDFQEEIESLKEEFKGTAKNIASRVLEVSSNKYQEFLQKYKEEIISLRKRLADSHNACNILRDSLDELVDIMEQILEMEKNGKLSLSHLPMSRRMSLQKTLNDSKSLSHSLSHSLMIGTDSILEDNEFSLSSPFEVPLSEITEEIDLAHLNLSMVANVLTSDQDRISDASSECHKDLIRALLVSEMDAKTEEIEAIFLKLNQLGNVVQLKDDRIKEQTDSIISLKSEIETLQRELRLTEKMLLQYRVVVSNGNTLCGNPQSVNCLSGPISSVAFNQPASLQHRIANTDPDFVENILFHPDSDRCSSSGSTALPPPAAAFFSSQEDSIRENVISDAKEGLIPNSSDVSKAVHSFNKLPIESREGMVLERLENAAAAPPVLNLASPSESEAWSEPDRNVSLARIGLDACNLIAANHDRSRSRTTKSAPFTSESDGESRPEEYRDGTPCSKSKRRSDAAEIKRLLSKLRNTEQMNETLRAELHIYQTLSLHFSEKSQPSTLEKSAGPSKSDGAPEAESSVTIPNSLFQEIRCLRRKLEEAITNNDLLRDQLEAALSGYLNEETRSLTGKLSTAQQEIKLNQEQLTTAAAIEQNLRSQLKQTDVQVFELNERLLHYLTSTEQMDMKLQQFNKDVKLYVEKISYLETNIAEAELELKRKDKNIKCYELKIQLLITECDTSKANLENLSTSNKEKETKIRDQDLRITKIEETACKYEISLKNLQHESTPRDKDMIDRLEQGLQESEQERLKVTKENLSLVKEITKLQSKLESFKTQSTILKMEVRELSTSEDSGCEKNLESLNKKLRTSHFSLQQVKKVNEAFKSENDVIKVEKAAMQKELQLLQEEAAALRSHLDHVLSRDTKISVKDYNNGEMATLQNAYDHLHLEHASLQDSFSSLKDRHNLTLDTEWDILKEKLEAYKSIEAEVERTDTKLREMQSKNNELVSQLDSERCLTKNLQMQYNSLQTTKMKTTTRENHQSGGTCPSSRSAATMIHPQLGGWKRIEEASYTHNKENHFPSRHHDNFSSSQFDDDATSGDSPDLGIGSDGQFSSMEKLNIRFNLGQVTSSNERISKLCSDTSHSRLSSENESIRRDCDCLRAKLKTTKVTLQETLDELSKANKRKEVVERTISRQLTKTRDCLRQAGVNLRHKQKESAGANNFT